jgi:hypothetical protein
MRMQSGKDNNQLITITPNPTNTMNINPQKIETTKQTIKRYSWYNIRTKQYALHSTVTKRTKQVTKAAAFTSKATANDMKRYVKVDTSSKKGQAEWRLVTAVIHKDITIKYCTYLDN